ncbi:MAG: outer membrane beta-barrel protein [Opitutae bacterium]|nr:outer membrane beta-barrel protein [Opitutae bacterium]
MKSPSTAKTNLLLLCALLLSLAPARALLNVDGSRNQLFVFGNVTFGHDSNVFSDATGRSDSTMAGAVGVQMKRRAGVIAVDATATLGYIYFGKFSDQNALNPNFHIELNKTAGRTTGDLTVSAYRQSRADSSVNLRTSSWNFPIGLNFKYPVNDKYYFTSQTTYLRRRYVDSNALANLTDYSQGFDVYYVYTSKLDLLGGYRIRVSQTTLSKGTTDHWFNLGATGSLFAKLNGSVRLGYQVRNVDGAGSYSHINAVASVGWPITRKINLAGTVSRDFNTIATGVSVDSTAVSLRASYNFKRQIEFLGGVAYGRNSFLGTPPPVRRDTFFSYDVGARYKMNEHLQVAATYTFFRNWSTFEFSDFKRDAVTIDISSRY